MEDSKNAPYLKDFYLDCGFATRALHAGEHVGQPQHVSHAGAIYQTSTFIFESAEAGAEIFAKNKDGYIYTRLGNPSVTLLEAKINALEGGDLKKKNKDIRVSTQAFSSGMGAISGALMAACSAGDTILIGNVVYGATENLASKILARYGVKIVEVDTGNLEAVKAAIEANPKATALFFETPTNPLLVCTDIQAVSDIVKAVNPSIKVIVDNTFATPYLQRPLELGADAVVHSTTKYINGHGTTVGGLVTTTDDSYKQAVYTVLADVGASPSPFDCWLINNGLKTLPIRMDKICENAMVIAEYLENHPKVDKVYYPGLKTNPYHELATRQMKNYGGMVSFELKGGLESGRIMMNNVKLFSLAVSLGSVDSLIQHPASMTHACVPTEKRLAGGITDGLVRISVGIEDKEDLIKALEEVLELV